MVKQSGLNVTTIWCLSGVFTIAKGVSQKNTRPINGPGGGSSRDDGKLTEPEPGQEIGEDCLSADEQRKDIEIAWKKETPCAI